MKRLSALLVLLMLVVSFAQAQSRQVTGTVTSSDDGSPLIGVSIQVKGTSNGGTTDLDGKYSLNVPANATLVFSFVGFKPQEVQVGERSIVNVILESESQKMEQVVVTAVGITRSEKSLGYSVSTVKSDELTTARDANVLNSLSGKVSGVRINTQSGTLGGSSKIIIRGANSLDGNNQPLFVIDGLPIDNSANGFGGTNGATADYGNRAGDINSDDVESVSVLKGAAATALYGARAKNGAIVITTKRGSKKSVTSVSVNSSYRFDQVLKLPDFQNEYAQGNYGVYNLKYVNGWGPKISDVQDQTFPNFLGDNVTLRAYPNNVKDFFKTGTTAINNVALSGGGDNSDYRMSFTSLNQTGIVPQEKLDRYTFAVNAGREFSKKLSARTSVSYTRTSGVGRPSQSSNNPNILTSAVFIIPRTVDMHQLESHYYDPVTGEQISLSPDKTGNNPYWIVNNNKNNNSVERMVGSGSMTYKPLSWVTITDNIGTDFYNEHRFSNTRKGTFGMLDGEFSTDEYYNRIVNNDLLITLEKTFNNWNVKTILGHNVNQVEYRRVSVDATTLTVDNLYTYTNAASTVATNYYSKKRLVGAFADVELAYKNYLFFSFTGRNDWSSTLPINNRSYFYPSAGVSLIFTELMPKNNILSFGKVRLNWANVGSDEAPYQLNFNYTAASTYFVQYSLSGTFPHGGIVAFTGPRTIPPTNLKPQNQQSVELGTDLKFFGNRISVAFSYYNTKTSNQIVAIDVPRSTGYFAQKVNIGEVKNTGIDLDLNIKPIVTKDFEWNMGVTFGKNKQTVEKLLDKPDAVYTLSSGWSGLQIKAAKGETFGLYGTAWQRDPKGNFIINPNTGLRQVVTNHRFGNIYPDWTMGINNNFSYKGVALSFLIDIRQGGVFYSGTVSSLRTSGLASETAANRGSIFIDKGVVDNGDGTYSPNTTPVQSMQDFWGQYASTSNTEGNVFDASYVKLREVTISYELPKKWLEKVAIGSAVIGLEGRNLWIIKDYVPHVDPELNFFGPTATGEGVEFNSVPSTRTFGVNLKLTF